MPGAIVPFCRRCGIELSPAGSLRITFFRTRAITEKSLTGGEARRTVFVPGTASVLQLKRFTLRHSDVAHCGPAFAVPSCASAPVVGFGSAGLGYGGLHSGILVRAGSPSFAVPFIASAPAVGFGSASLGHNIGAPSASLGVIFTVNPSCINQIPPAKVMIQPPPVVMTLPGPILSATGEPVAVGGSTSCNVSYGGPGKVVSGASFGSLEGSFGGRLGSTLDSLILGHRGSCSPCN
ncbi:uncharacterized protein LOC132584475 [Heteronotia binoei]|uniref:uncharacterized protein LOC132584475 n=1 Tax=Heteronotia binoei TaxID=13085 RepID=UPI0029306389|nr:uncharacterized protein LOC132584475 [Heteronotia binoei]